MVPVVDLSRRGRRLAPQFAERAAAITAGGQYLLGPELAAFETELAGAVGADAAVAVSSGASAIQLALTAFGVGNGDDVVVPAFTAVPTASAVVAAGARPVLADVDRDTACVTPASLAAACTARTRMLVVVHLYGLRAILPSGDEIPAGVRVVEDAAQALGSVAPGTTSDAVTYSFYPTKNLGGIGDGGAVTTSDLTAAATIARLRVHGMTSQYVHTEVSQNHRMSELEAAWLRIGLETVDDDRATRRRIAAIYRAAAPHLRWQVDDEHHSYHLCVFRHARRDEVRNALATAGVGTAVHYPLALCDQPAYRDVFADEAARCVEARRWAAECVTVPCFAEMTDPEVEQVAGALAALEPDQ